MHNLIDFTPTEVVRTANYAVQRLFSTTVGDWIVPVTGLLPERVHASCTSTNDALSIKLVNLSEEPVALRIELPGTAATFATVALLRGAPQARNDLDEGGKPRLAVRPVTSRMDLEGEGLTLELPSSALVVLAVRG
jgi:Alpha-L-arabinofuranosidase C-terminal domain